MPLWCIFIYTHMDNYNIENNNEQHECCMHGPGPDLHCSCVTTGNCSGADYKMFEWDYKCPTCTFHPDPFKRLQCFIRALATKGLASEKKIEEIEKILSGDDNVEGLIDKVESMLTDATIGGSVSIATGGGAAVGNANVDFDYGTGKKRGTDLTGVVNTVNYGGTCSSQIMDSDPHTKILNAQIDVVYFNAKNESGSFNRQTARLQVNITYSNGVYDIEDVATKFATLGDFTLYGRPYLEVTQNSSDQTKADVNMYFCLTSAKLQIHSVTIELHNDNGQLPYFVQTRNDIDHNYTYSNNKKVVYFDTWDNVIVIFINGKWYKLADADPFPLRPTSGS